MVNLSNKKFSVVGAGLVGSLVALRLLQKGFQIEVYESREDMRLHPMSAGRSINLALSHRGLEALKLVGLEEQVLSHSIQMKGRMIHSINGELNFQPYSIREGEHINSISRRVLNVILMDEIEKHGVRIKFSHRLETYDNNMDLFTFSCNGEKVFVSGNSVIATDGASSSARKFMLENSAELRMNYQQKFQPYGYKELTIPPGPESKFLLEKNALHIWPRGHFMMIALPNPDASFTATLFIPFIGLEGFESLSDKQSLDSFFSNYFSDAKLLIPDLTQEFFSNPTGHLNSVKCSPWSYKDRILLMGDAAHAIIPFYGQGMNCGFEDVVVFDQLLDTCTDIESLFRRFELQRKINSDAISDLAEDNFEEMRDKVADPVFQRKRLLEAQLEEKFPKYYSKYALVTFRPDISYSEAMVKGRKQDEYLLEICKTQFEFSNSDLETIFNNLNQIT
ncbi:MAG: FAD-dependent monooxygenase [Saprospiraceae bacterium]|nr:FAD-dependent monooxygenase [Saprospiraceae bacterium]